MKQQNIVKKMQYFEKQLKNSSKKCKNFRKKKYINKIYI